MGKAIYQDVYKDYISGKLELEKDQKIGIFLLVFVIAGFAGWLWEFLLAFFFGGFKIYAKGGNLLPWINLYAFGAIAIIATTYWVRRHPWAVFAVGFIATGLLELLAGWLVFMIGNGTRYWDYRQDWWGVGAINGFVCPASALAFGAGALLLMYVVLPFVVYLSCVMPRKRFLTLAVTLFVLVIADEIINLSLKNLDLPTAMDFYRARGLKYPSDV